MNSSEPKRATRKSKEENLISIFFFFFLNILANKVLNTRNTTLL